MPYYKYRTDYGNTIIAVSSNSFVLGPNEAQLLSATEIPAIQPPYLYRVVSTSVVENIDANINTYLESNGVDTSQPATMDAVTAITSTLTPKTSFNTLTGTTLPTTYVLKTVFSSFTGTTAPLTYQSKASVVLLTGSTLPSTYVNKTQYNLFTGTTISSANNGLTESPNQSVRLGGTLTGNTTIITATGSRLNISGWPMQYSTDLSANYNLRSFVDKAYITGNTIFTANNGLNKISQNVRLGGSLTGNTTITTATGSRLNIAGWPAQYSTDLSSNYSPRSFVDKGYVTGYTQHYKYNVGAAPTQVIATKIFTASATTDSSGVATFQVTTNGINTGTAIFTKAYSIQASAANNTNQTSVIPLASVKDFSTLKTLTINVEQSNTVLIGGQGLTFVSSGIVVYVTIMGI